MQRAPWLTLSLFIHVGLNSARPRFQGELREVLKASREKSSRQKIPLETCSQLLKGNKKENHQLLSQIFANFAAACSAYHQSRVEQVFFFSEKILFPEVTEAEERKSE